MNKRIPLTEIPPLKGDIFFLALSGKINYIRGNDHNPLPFQGDAMKNWVSFVVIALMLGVIAIAVGELFFR